MTSPAPLTEAQKAAIEKAAAKAAGEGLTSAELAAATAMADKQNRDELAAGYGAAAMPGDFADEARAVVAAVRSHLYDEVADRMLLHATEAELNDATEDAVHVFEVAANQIREWAAPSRPTS